MSEFISLVGICFALPVLLCVLLSGGWKQKNAWLFSLAAVVVFTVNLLAVSWLPSVLPKIAFFEALSWNWLGKICTILSTLGVYALLSPKLKAEAGLFAKPHPPEWTSVWVVSIMTVLGFSLVGWLENKGAIGTSLETTLFQATMPGLDEESCLRGTLLALLIAAFGKPWRIAGIRLGWGALPIIAMFGLVHGFSATSAGQSIDWGVVLLTGVMGVSFLWLKERTGSIWIPVLVHNLSNVGSTWLGGN